MDIQSDSEFAQAEAQAAFAGAGSDDDDYSGRCSAILTNGKRCPNTALPGSKYCGVPQHQELVGSEPAGPVDIETTPAADLAPGSIALEEATADEVDEADAVAPSEPEETDDAAV